MKNSKKKITEFETENPRYHDTVLLLQKYRDVTWSLEVSVAQARGDFRSEFGITIEDYLDSVYCAGGELMESKFEDRAKGIKRSYEMLKLLDGAVELLRAKHKHGEEYYWILYFSFLSPQQFPNLEALFDAIRPYVREISYRTYYRKRKEAVDVLSSLLWGYVGQDTKGLLDRFFPPDQLSGA